MVVHHLTENDEISDHKPYTQNYLEKKKMQIIILLVHCKRLQM